MRGRDHTRPLLKELDQARLTEPGKKLGHGFAFDNFCLRIAKFQQNGDNMFVIAALIVGANTMRIRDAAVVQPDRNLVGLELAALRRADADWRQPPR